jgi:hypothetical protein
LALLQFPSCEKAEIRNGRANGLLVQSVRYVLSRTHWLSLDPVNTLLRGDLCNADITAYPILLKRAFDRQADPSLYKR